MFLPPIVTIAYPVNKQNVHVRLYFKLSAAKIPFLRLDAQSKNSHPFRYQLHDNRSH